MLRTQRCIDIAGEEIELARLWVNRAVGQHQFDAIDVLVGDTAASELGQIAVTETETDPDRVTLVTVSYTHLDVYKRQERKLFSDSSC